MENKNRISFFEKYRPKTFEELIFPNQETKEYLMNSVHNASLNNILIYGTAGNGKSSAAQIIAKSLVSSPKDLFILGRSTTDIDELSPWLVREKADSSRKKIVLIEEVDKLSKQAQTLLKDTLMERYQGSVIFIATTNNASALDSALLQRFVVKITFDDVPKLEHEISKLVHRILKIEEIEYNETELNEFINICSNNSTSIRDTLSFLEVSCFFGNKFDFEKGKKVFGSIGVNANLVQAVMYMSQVLMAMLDDKGVSKEDMYNVYKNPLGIQEDHLQKYGVYIKQYYEFVLKETQSSTGLLNFDYIYSALLETSPDKINLIHKNTIMNYFQDNNLKRFKNLHFLACCADMIKIVYEMK